MATAKLKPVKGGVLRPNAATLARFDAQWQALIKQMTSETTRELTALFKQESSVFDSLEHRIAAEVRASHAAGVAYDLKHGRVTPEVSAMDATLADMAQGVIDRLLAKFTVLFNRQADGITNTMVQATNRDSERGMQKSLKDVGADLTIVPTDKTRQLVDAAAQESAGLIKRTPQEYLPLVQGDVMRSITTGNGLQDLVPALEERNVKVKNWAANVARDQTRKVYNNVNKVRMQDAGAEEFEWIHSGGSNKPRKLHLDRTPAGLNGGIFRFDDPPVIDERTGEKGIPGQLPYCLPARSVVEIPAGVNKLYRRVYTGELLTLIAGDGVRLEATPNHPVLTQRGWIAAQHVDIGDYLIHSGSYGKVAGKADINNAVSGIAQLFNTTLLLIGSAAVSTTGTELQFHGDGSDNEVNVIDIDGLLPFKGNATLCEKFCKEVFSWADAYGSVRKSLPDLSTQTLCLLGVTGAAPSFMGSLNNALSLLCGSGSEVENARFACSAWLNSCFDQTMPDDGSADSKLLRQLLFGNSSCVQVDNCIGGYILACAARWWRQIQGDTASAEEFAQVVRVNFENGRNRFKVAGTIKEFQRVREKIVSKFVGHVYNVESGSGWLIANNIVNHNCGCTMRPVFRFDKDE